MTASRANLETTRRRFVGGAAAIGAAALPLTLGAAPASAAPVEASLTDYVAPDPLLHLLRRATFGPTPALVANIRELGADGWLKRQLAPTSIDDALCNGIVGRFPLASLSITGVRDAVRRGAMDQYGWAAMQQLGFAATARATWSNRQLFEVMVDFWSNHLNVTNPSADVWDGRPDYDRTVIRAFALGRFADMLKASARHPAMLTYLDNRFSTRAAPNENYGRELLELHTVGLIYSEADVKNAARLLTGLTVSWETGKYRYDSGAHATGPVSVLGFTAANATAAGGEAAALALIDYLALHPGTARRIAAKLCVRFVSDDPPAALVARLAQVYLDNGSAIAPVLRALFTSAEFAASAGAKVRTPFEDIVATVRAVGYGPDATGTAAVEALYWIAGSAGQAPMSWAPPNGFPDVAAAWATPANQLIRWNAHVNITAGWWPTQLTRPADLFRSMIGALPTTYGAVIDALAMRLFGRTLKSEHTKALAAFFRKTPESPVSPGDDVTGAAFAYLVTLMLNSPYFAVR